MVGAPGKDRIAVLKGFELSQEDVLFGDGLEHGRYTEVDYQLS